MATLPERIGKYRVVRRLSQGGMGVVYLAHDDALDSPVAIKVIRDDWADEEGRARFLREARLARSLRHSSIVKIWEYGEHEHQPFIAMEFIAGSTLAATIAGATPLPLGKKLRILEELCEGLHDAHVTGLVHRDVKPANIMLQPDGRVRILDFGIARATGSTHTVGGAVIGSPNYMSPEQVGGRELTSLTDVFSVGAVAYELLSGRQAFPGTLGDGVFARILEMDPPPLDLAAGDDAGIERIVAKALRKSTLERYKSLDVMRRDLQAVRTRLAVGETARLTDATLGEALMPAAARTAPATTLVVSEHGAPRGFSRDDQNLRAPFDGAEKTPPRALGPIGIVAGIAVAGVVLALFFSSGRGETSTPIDRAGTRDPGVTDNGLWRPAVTPGTTPKMSTRPAAPVQSPARGSPTPRESAVTRLASDSPAITSAPAESEPAPLAQPAATAAAEPPAAEPPAPPATAPSRGLIPELLREYQQAYAEKSTAELKRLNPALTQADLAALDRAFLESRSYQLQLSNIAMTQSGDQVKVTAAALEAIEPLNGERRVVSSRMTFVFEPSATTWRIVSYESRRR